MPADTYSDDEILQRYVQMAALVGEMFAPDLEAIVHDLRQPDSSIIAITNGHVTGRKVGDATSDLGRRRVRGEVPDKIVNYQNESPFGDPMRSSTLAIRRRDGQLLGSISFNFRLTAFQDFAKFLGTFVSGQRYDFLESKEQFFFKKPKEEIREAYRQFLAQKGWQGRTLSGDQKKDVVRHFYEQGHFNKRGIVTEIADILKLTRATVYRYLKNVPN